MTRFSDKAMEVFEQWFYHTDIKEMMRITEELTDPLDIAFTKLWVSYREIVCQDYELALSTLLEIEKINKELRDEYIGLILDINYCLYYTRVNGPVLDQKKAYEYLKKIEERYRTTKGANDFEKYMIETAYYNLKGMIKWKIENNIPGEIEYRIKAIESSRQIPKYGEHIVINHEFNLAGDHLLIGNIDEAEELLIKYKKNIKQNSSSMLFAYSLSMGIEYVRCDFDEYVKINAKMIDLAKKINDIYWISVGLTHKAIFLYHEGKYDEALEYYNESLEYKKAYTPLHYCKGKYDIFMYHYKLYELKNEPSCWEKAKETYRDLKELSYNNDNAEIEYYSSTARALILKKGDLRDKGKAMDILEELSDLYPTSLQISLHLMELLFDDYSLSENELIIQHIDSLMERLIKTTAFYGPLEIEEYVKFQILGAKYYFLVKRDPVKALEVLNTAKMMLERNKLEHMLNQLNLEIEDMENELTRWNSLDQSVKKQIKTSEMRKYIRKALVSMKSQYQIQE